MPCGTKLRSNKNAKSDLTLTPDKLDYIYICIYFIFLFYLLLLDFSTVRRQFCTIRFFYN